jgi:metal-sulfur cluster biosynthetic enzyme
MQDAGPMGFGFRRNDDPPQAVDPPASERVAKEREAQVWDGLQQVADPELDQSIVELGFVSAVGIDGDIASVTLRLPTFWCSASFAWIMAEDMRLALHALPWLRRADIRLVDHFAADQINRGIADGRGFRQTFLAAAGGHLGELRATFRRKAFLGRMSALMEALRQRGWSEERIVTARIKDLTDISCQPPLRPLLERYIELRAFFGGSCGTDDLAFRTAEGQPIPASRLPAYLRDIRLTRRGIEANGEMCRILLAERYGEPAASRGEGGANDLAGCTPPPARSVRA